ncbi:unnamed protein product [Schistosoma haematobium]|nr:unnamed protein product [Schistosoma haematobium]
MHKGWNSLQGRVCVCLRSILKTQPDSYCLCCIWCMLPPVVNRYHNLVYGSPNKEVRNCVVLTTRITVCDIYQFRFISFWLLLNDAFLLPKELCNG